MKEVLRSWDRTPFLGLRDCYHSAILKFIFIRPLVIFFRSSKNPRTSGFAARKAKNKYIEIRSFPPTFFASWQWYMTEQESLPSLQGKKCFQSCCPRAVVAPVSPPSLSSHYRLRHDVHDAECGKDSFFSVALMSCTKSRVKVRTKGWGSAGKVSNMAAGWWREKAMKVPLFAQGSWQIQYY